MIRALVVVVGIALLAPSAPVRAERLVDHEQVVDLTPYDTIGYRRGRRVKIKVVQIGWAEVEVRTAKAFLRMQTAAAEDGVGLYIRSGFRSHEIQQWLDAQATVAGVVILDEGHGMDHLEPWLVAIDHVDGLQDVHVDRAVARLLAPPPPRKG